MLKVGLTGSIGSGKTLVSKIFLSLGVKVYNADQEAKKLLEEKPIVDELIGLFGKTILDRSNTILRNKLADIVFNDSKALESLNAIIHPRVQEDFREWLKIHEDESYVLQEAAILFESGFYEMFDKTIVVTAPQELRISRVMLRDNISRSEVMARMKNQWTDEEKSERADYIIINDGRKMIIPRVMELHELLIDIAENY